MAGRALALPPVAGLARRRAHHARGRHLDRASWPSTAFVVMRQQLMSSLDQSLLNRAHKATADTALSEITVQGVPAWMLGAADVRDHLHHRRRPSGVGRRHPRLHPRPAASYDVASGTARVGGAHARHRRGRALPRRDRAGQQRPGARSSPSRSPPTTARWRSSAGCSSSSARSGVLAALLAGWLRGPQRPETRAPADLLGRAHRRHRGPRPRCRIEGDDEVARLATAFNQMLLALGASRDRQRRLVADAGHELRTPLTSLRTNLDLLRQAEGNAALPAEARLELLDDVRAPDRGAQCARGRPRRAGPRRADHPRRRARSTSPTSSSGRSTRVRRRAHGVSFDVDARTVARSSATRAASSAR